MNLFKADQIMDRLNLMLDQAMAGGPVDTGYDETKMSALEARMNQYLNMTQSSRLQLEEEKNHVKELISDISHQTKTPVSNILLYSQLLEEGGLPQECMEYVQALESQAKKLSFLIDSLVKASRLETGIIAVQPAAAEIMPILKGAYEQIKGKACEKQITCSLRDTDIVACVDSKWMQEAVYNILDNAVKYTGRGGNVFLSAVTTGLFSRIDIRDDGIGIREEEQGKIFTRFYRSPSVSSEEGVGIGLYLAREIVMKQGGFMKVTSEPGKGTLFSIYLPVVQ